MATYIAYLSINDTDGRSLNFSDTPTVTVWNGLTKAAIASPSPTLTNITTGLYAVEIELAIKTDVLFKVVPHVDDQDDIADIKVIHEGYIETVGELAKPGDAMTLADGAIKAATLASNTITADKIASNAITDAKIASGAITDAKIATDAFSAAKFKADAVTKIQNGLAKATDIPSVSDIATAVWGAVTRTLTGGLITAQNVWEYVTRTLTASPTDISNLAEKDDIPTDYAKEATLTAIDLLVEAVKAKTDNLPASPAAAAEYSTALAAILTAIDEIEMSGGGGGSSAKQIWEYPDRSLTENPTDLTSLVLLLTTIADNTGTAIPQLLAGLPAGVWSYITRTLTVSSVKPRTLPDGDQFSIYKDTSVLIPLTDLGDISAYTNLWFTMKREMDLQAGDEKAIIHADKVTGLLYIDQAVADDELGGITINDPTAGNISVWLHKSAAALLPVFSKEPLRWEVKGISPAGVDILLQGTNYILPAVTRKIT